MLVQQIAEREVFRIVVDGHGGDDLLRIEEDREGALDGDPRLDPRPGLIDAGDALGQAWIGRVRADKIVVIRHAANVGNAPPRRKRDGVGWVSSLRDPTLLS